MMSKFVEKYSKHNAWISLLRIFMCIVVIQDHFGTSGTTILQKGVGFFGALAVPVFMFISFYFMVNDLVYTGGGQN